MIAAICLTALSLTAWAGDADTKADAEFIVRVEKTEWLDSSGKPFETPRVERDEKGNVETLRLSGMTLKADDFAAIARIKTLKHLDLYRTNVTDADLKKLHDLPELQSMNLSSTDVTDAAIDEFVKFPSLRTLCLGGVPITPQAIVQLKGDFQVRGRKLSMGYSQKK